jgi:predicted HicB family RNase H-like nuclease
LCLEFPYFTERAPTAREAIAAIEQTITEHVADYQASGYELPPSLTDRIYSGKFVVRTSTALHARLAVEAVEQGVSLNQWVVQKLADRKTTLDDW